MMKQASESLAGRVAVVPILTRWDSPETLEISAMTGAFFETFAVSEVFKSYYNAEKRPPVFYYRDTDQKEIDLIRQWSSFGGSYVSHRSKWVWNEPTIKR